MALRGAFFVALVAALVAAASASPFHQALKAHLTQLSTIKAFTQCGWTPPTDEIKDHYRTLEQTGKHIMMTMPGTVLEVPPVSVQYWADFLCTHRKDTWMKIYNMDINTWNTDMAWQQQNPELVQLAAQHVNDNNYVVNVNRDPNFVHQSAQQVYAGAGAVPAAAQPVSSWTPVPNAQVVPEGMQTPAALPEPQENYAQSYQDATPSSGGGVTLSTFGVFFIGLAGGMMVMYFFHDKLTAPAGPTGVQMKPMRRDAALD